MAAIHFLFDTLLQLAILAVLTRLLLQLVGANFRNPLAAAIVQITSPILVPIRRLLPSVGRLDSAALLLLLVLGALRVALPYLLTGFGLPPPVFWLTRTLITLARTLLYYYLFAILIFAVLGMIAQGVGYSPAQSLLHDLCEPLLGRIRRVIPPLGMIDFSPLWAMIVIQVVLLLLPA